MPTASYVRGKNGGCLIDLYVTPGAWKDVIVGVRDDGRLKVAVTAQPEDGKANKAVLKLFKGFFGECKLVSGARSRKKTVYVKDASPEKVAETISKHI